MDRCRCRQTPPSSSDKRPESYSPQEGSMKLGKIIPPTSPEARKDIIFRNTRKFRDFDTVFSLAKDFKIEEHKVQYPCFVQKKYDGMRMLAIKKNGIVKLISRKGKEITTLDHIKIQLEADSIPDNIYDGEAYSLEVGTFQEQMKAIKKESENTPKIDFNIYDVVLNIPYVGRLEILKNIFNA